VTIDNDLHQVGEQLICLYSTDATQIGGTVTVEDRNGKAIWLAVAGVEVCDLRARVCDRSAGFQHGMLVQIC